jgi:hypothetical protein
MEMRSYSYVHLAALQKRAAASTFWELTIEELSYNPAYSSKMPGKKMARLQSKQSSR